MPSPLLNSALIAVSLRLSCTLLAPFYDLVARARSQSLEQLPRDVRGDIFLNGIATGLGLPYLPTGYR